MTSLLISFLFVFYKVSAIQYDREAYIPSYTRQGIPPSGYGRPSYYGQYNYNSYQSGYGRLFNRDYNTINAYQRPNGYARPQYNEQGQRSSYGRPNTYQPSYPEYKSNPLPQGEVVPSTGLNPSPQFPSPPITSSTTDFGKQIEVAPAVPTNPEPIPGETSGVGPIPEGPSPPAVSPPIPSPPIPSHLPSWQVPVSVGGPQLPPGVPMPPTDKELGLSIDNNNTNVPSGVPMPPVDPHRFPRLEPGMIDPSGDTVEGRPRGAPAS